MIASRIVCSNATLRIKSGSIARHCNNVLSLSPSSVAASMASSFVLSRSYAVNNLTKNLQLITTDKDVKLTRDSSGLKVIQKDAKPLVLLFSWMLPKEKHLKKYAQIYVDQGFDVLTVQLMPWQLLWPVKGSQVVAGDVVKFLHTNYLHEPLFLHGFSVGGYLFGEVLVKLHEEAEKYKPIIDRFVGQVWDSAADITEIPVGFPRALFPGNRVMQMLTEKYIRYHMTTFHDTATCHYIRSSQMFHTTLVKAPALFLLSKTDPVGSEESNNRVRESWAAGGIQTYWKCWDRSPHVGHYRTHPEEYKAELFQFLNKLSLIQHPEKLRAKL